MKRDPQTLLTDCQSCGHDSAIDGLCSECRAYCSCDHADRNCEGNLRWRDGKILCGWHSAVQAQHKTGDFGR